MFKILLLGDWGSTCMIMDSLSMPSVSEQARDNGINRKFLPPRKPARQPNPVIHRRLRRGSAAARNPGKQTEYPTNKELLRTIAYLRNATAVFYEPDKILPYNKAYIDDEDDDEEIIEDDEEPNSLPNNEKGKQEFEASTQKTSKNSSYPSIKKQKKNSSHIVKASEGCGVSASTPHVVVNLKDTNETSDHGQGLTKILHKSDLTYKAFIQFCSTEIICPQEHRAALAVKLFGVQAALLSALGNPYDNLSQSTISNSSSKIPLSLGQASTRFLPAMVWTGMFIASFVYTVMVVWSLAFRVPIISMLCLSLLYSLSLLVAAASGFNVICGTFRMHGISFALLGIVGFVMLLVGLVMLVLFTSWRYNKLEAEVG